MAASLLQLQRVQPRPLVPIGRQVDEFTGQCLTRMDPFPPGVLSPSVNSMSEVTGVAPPVASLQL